MPSAFDVNTAFVPIAALETITDAPGITDPDGSRTLPEMVPRVSCDQAKAEVNRASVATSENTFMVFFRSPILTASSPDVAGLPKLTHRICESK
jgi:hypothetical protein